MQVKPSNMVRFRFYDLDILKRSYQEKFNRSLASLDSKSFGVNNIVELLEKLADKKMVVLIDEPEMKEKFVLSARMVEIRQKVFLKLNVQEFLDGHGGQIFFNSFEDLYEDKYKVKLNYHHYGLTNLDDLCEVFKDMLVVEVPDPTTGVKVIKDVKGYYNLRKRKR
ncbi:calcium-transporting ATPase 2, plasma membrane-type-like protein [Tanacetum coccineum]